MRIIVTGGAGFIGSWLVRHLVSQTTHSVLNLDKLTYAANPDNLLDVAGAQTYEFRQVDICDAVSVDRAFREFRPDAVMHLAAESHVDRSILAARDFVDTNVLGTFTLLEAARRYRDDLPAPQRDAFRFLHVSTDEVFGSLGAEGLFREDTPYAPNSPYSASKASSDMLARAWFHTHGLPVLISNCSNNYGPYQFPEKLIPVVILSALEGRPIPVYGDGMNVRDWLYVEDHIAALMVILEKGVPGETYNVGGHNEATNIDLVTRICAVLDEALPQSTSRPHADLISFVEDRKGHDRRYAIDPSKIGAELGWRTQTSVDVGLRKTVHWYLHNSDWWQPLRERASLRNLTAAKEAG